MSISSMIHQLYRAERCCGFQQSVLFLALYTMRLAIYGSFCVDGAALKEYWWRPRL